MTQDLFIELANKAGLSVKQSNVISWSGVAKLDGVTLVEK